MLSREEQFDIALDVFQRLTSESGTSQLAPLPMSLPETPIASQAYAPAENGRSLKDLLRKIGPLPAYTAIVGQCSDGLPFLFDLNDPTPGAVLIIGSPASGTTDLLRSILISAANLNRQDQVAFTVITPNPGEFQALNRLPSCREVVSTYDRYTTEVVVTHAEVTEQRKGGRNRGPALILAIDDLPGLLQYNEYELNVYLRWLLENGPRQGIWTIATIQAEQLAHIDQQILHSYGTRFINQGSSAYLPQSNSHYTHQINPGQFYTQVGGEPVYFTVPDFR